jgi:hypothetical protein
VNSKFRLGASSNGINPVTEAVVFQLGSFLAIVPPASFAKRTDGSFVFDGVISGVSLKIRIRPLEDGGFAFRVHGSGVNLAWRELARADPVSVGLAIGDDTGVTALSGDESTSDSESTGLGDTLRHSEKSSGGRGIHIWL